MTPREMARDLAQAIASGQINSLPRLTPAAPPEFARAYLLAHYELRDMAAQMRREQRPGMSVRDRIAFSSLVAEIEAGIEDARAWLSRVARRGGRGLPALAGAGRSPAVEGHGCPAVAAGGLPPAVAVGPAPADLGAAQPLDITIPDNPLFCGQPVQELPEGNPLPHARLTREETPA